MNLTFSEKMYTINNLFPDLVQEVGAITVQNIDIDEDLLQKAQKMLKGIGSHTETDLKKDHNKRNHMMKKIEKKTIVIREIKIRKEENGLAAVVEEDHGKIKKQKVIKGGMIQILIVYQAKALQVAEVVVVALAEVVAAAIVTNL